MEVITAAIGFATTLLTLLAAVYQFRKERALRAGSASGRNSTPTPESHRKWGIIALTSSFAALLSTAVALLVVIPNLRPKPSVTVTSPRNNTPVPFQVNVTANSQNVPDGSVIWPVILEDGAKYHPGDNPCAQDNDADGTLSCPKLYVGSDGKASIGKSFTILFCSADDDWQEKFETYDRQVKASNDYTGMEYNQLKGLVIAGRVRVTRR